jgi:phosphatidylserine/phosphatidylglycerophosphate/cardiolipin synthase-like enzyme
MGSRQTLMPVRTPRPDRVVIAPEARRAALLDVICQARNRISLSLFRCNDKAVFAELRAAVDRGVAVEVLITSRAKGGKKKLRKLWKRLEETGAALSSYEDPVVKYHAKYLVADDGPAVVASLNLTKKCFNTTCDALVITHDPAVVTGLRDLMDADRHNLPAPATLPDRLIVGPERARRQFTALIEQARTSIRLIDPKFSDPGLVSLLNARRAAGLQVEVHDDRRFGDLKSHGKIMLVDDAKAVIGSLALTALSLDFRREVAIAVDEPAAVADIRGLFESIGRPAGATGAAPAATAGGASC